MKYFSIKELCVSDSYPNLVVVPKEGSLEYNNLKRLIEEVLDPIREKLGGPVTVSSGFRNKKLNTAIQGASNSNHLTGCAADIHFGKNRSDNVKIVEALLQLNITYDECLVERAAFNKEGELISASWIHVALRPSNNRKKLLYTTDLKNYYKLKTGVKLSK